MKAPIILVEGYSDKAILSRFLPKDVLESVEFGIANGRTAAQALARSILSANVRPVVLVLDSDSTEHDRISELKEIIEYSFREASSGSPYKLVLAIPTIEVLLVQNERILGALAPGHELKPFELDYAKQNPKQYLRQRFQCSADYASCLSKILVNLPPDVAREESANGLVGEIVDFVRSVESERVRSSAGLMR